MSAMRALRLASPRRVASAAIAVLLCACVGQARQTTQTSFASEIAALSEPPGYFDTDNLISNERSYLHVLQELDRAGVKGGAYVGVGPDQNFSYIAHIRPAIAFIIDIRRDNLLLHLLFKSLFGLSRTRVEYLALLTGRPVPDSLAEWPAKSIGELTAYIDAARPADARSIDALRARVERRIKGFGVPLSADDLAAIDRFHREFIGAGLGLQFRSTGRSPQSNYPTLRHLLLETDRFGRRANYLASEDAFQFVKSLQARDLVIPVVGNLNGPTALTAIGRAITARNERLSAFYASNVEFYLFRDGTFPRFVDNLTRLPHSSRAVIIRSVFDGRSQVEPGYASASLTHALDDLIAGFAKGRYRQYWELTQR